jgi:arabinofuranosyltransferase
MTGRFLSAPAIVAIAILAPYVSWPPRRAAAVATAALAIGLAMPQSPLRVWRQPRPGDPLVSHGHGILDERAVYAPYTGVVPVLTRGVHPRDHPWAVGGRAMGAMPRVATFEAVGLLGYYAGPGLHVVDPMALTDPLLARLPADRPWRIGHFRRTLPEGYVGMLEACIANAFPGRAVAPPVATCLDVPEALTTMPGPEGAKYQRIAAFTQLPLWDARRLTALRRGGL